MPHEYSAKLQKMQNVLAFQDIVTMAVDSIPLLIQNYF